VDFLFVSGPVTTFKALKTLFALMKTFLLPQTVIVFYLICGTHRKIHHILLLKFLLDLSFPLGTSPTREIVLSLRVMTNLKLVDIVGFNVIKNIWSFAKHCIKFRIITRKTNKIKLLF